MAEPQTTVSRDKLWARLPTDLKKYIREERSKAFAQGYTDAMLEAEDFFISQLEEAVEWE